jgi:pimeloyl-ACP methyl ester carboxylesterase
MQRVRSKDGTMIAMDRSGRGPALVLITGACTDRSSTKALASGLAERYTVYEFDRRGRGDSDQAGPYAIEREVEDLAAVIDAAGGSAYGFGHSSGGALALEAAARGVPLRAVVVYEPPFTTGPNDDLADELDQLAGAGRNSEACARFLALFTPQPVIDRMKTGLYWAHMTADAPTLAHEVRLSNNGTVPTDRLAKITVPVLALAGRDSPAWAREVADALAKAVPNSQSRVLADQPHGVADAGADPSAARSLQLTDTAPPSGCLGREPTAVLSAFSSSEAENLAVTARERIGLARTRDPHAAGPSFSVGRGPAAERLHEHQGAGTACRALRGAHANVMKVARREESGTACSPLLSSLVYVVTVRSGPPITAPSYSHATPRLDASASTSGRWATSHGRSTRRRDRTQHPLLPQGRPRHAFPRRKAPGLPDECARVVSRRSV